jgi:Uma2 family endonuclease
MSQVPTRPPETGASAACEWDHTLPHPSQGEWTEQAYFDLPNNVGIELRDGHLDFLPMVTFSHQRTSAFLFKALDAFAEAGRLGVVVFMGLPVRLWPGRQVEPDVLFMFQEHAERMGENCWDGADLVMEILSPSNRSHDLVTKRADYARGGIPEYWIIDPKDETITVLTLAGDAYATHGTFRAGERATSVLLPGFAVDVTAALAGQA